ncbi:MAG TPA: methylene-tetrahydromethanopterin dehydrogenase N-terminal domain-containing protein [Gemmatimonadaceae bacterium]|nr:methylene-tetrahydromethanopterin dehydrogenase N-terminal domain-containing protein [Gemmatimonadaceae bacterium]
MRKLLLQLDSNRLPSVFDRVVGYDAGADEILSYGGIVAADVRDLIYGLIFTRGPKDLANSAVFIGGQDINVGDAILTAAQEVYFGAFRVSLMLDSNGSNTTAVAAVAKIMQSAGDLQGKRVVVTAGTGPVGARAAGLLAKQGADVLITSRRGPDGERALRNIVARFGGKLSCVQMSEPSQAAGVLEGAVVVLNCGPAGVQLIPRAAWANRTGLKVAVDLNAAPPLGIEGIEANDNGVTRDGVICYGALGVGGLKMKIHKRCIARLFESNDAVLDAEAIFDLARALG